MRTTPTVRRITCAPAPLCAVHCGRSSLRLQYLPALRRTLTEPLLAGEKDGIQPVVEDMHSYALNKVNKALRV